MRSINGIEYYTIPETIQITNINEKTLYRYIKEKKVSYTRFMNQYYINKASVEKLQEQNQPKFEIVITKGDIESDTWLNNKDNLVKLKHWSISSYTQWGDMQLDDYIAYWKYLIYPLWKKLKKTNDLYPTKQWLIDQRFVGFVNSFRKRYLEPSGITTLLTFFDYLEGKRKKGNQND